MFKSELRTSPLARPHLPQPAAQREATRARVPQHGAARALALQRTYGNQAVRRLIAQRQGALAVVQRMSAETAAEMAAEIHGGTSESTTAAAQASNGDVAVYTQSQFADGAAATIRSYLKEDGHPRASIYEVKLAAGKLTSKSAFTGKHAEMAIYHNVGDLVDDYGASQKVCGRCSKFLDAKGKTYAPTGGKDTKYWWHPEKGETYSSGAMYPTKDATTVTSDRDKW